MDNEDRAFPRAGDVKAPGAGPSPAPALDAEASAGAQSGTLKVVRPNPATAEIPEGPGTVIGHYKLLEALGEGGCGVVYLAEQTEPVHRRVALKVVKLGMDTREMVARFEAERQALALMEHPNIAKVLDAGATRSGRPYFVMELVRGMPITRYCDEHRLPVGDRLALFIQVCHAIQHAHQKGIIHRDIKPSNVLVSEQERSPVPKVIDFGIAKATAQQRLTDKTLYTAYEQFIGTPAYMSPEQANASSLDIDTRTDVYSLGVMLYELLTGKTPFDSKRLSEAGFEDVRRVIREEDPPRPSARFHTLEAGEQTTLAKQRQIEPPRLISLIRGDLDWIVMKALEKDRSRRYETANAFAMDVQRFLDDEPVAAGPPSKLYRFRKLVRRNKPAFAAGVAVVLALVLGLGVSLWALYRARTEAVKSQQTAQLLEEMLGGVGPSVALGRDVTLLREILDKTAQRLGSELKEQPEVEFELRSLIGRTYEEVGEFPRAETMQREALRLGNELYGKRDIRVSEVLTDLGRTLQQRGQFTAAESILQEALETIRRLAGNHPTAASAAMHQLGIVYSKQARYAEAEPWIRQAMTLRQQALGEENFYTLSSKQALAVLYFRQRRHRELEPLITGLVDTERRALGTDHPLTLKSMAILAELDREQGRFGEAEALQREILETKRRVFGPQHPETLASMNNLGVLYGFEGRDAEAETLCKQALEAARQKLDAEDPDLLGSMSNLAEYYRNQGRYAEAETLFRQVMEVNRRTLPGTHPFRLETMNSLAVLYRLQARYAEAEQLAEQVLEARRAAQGATGPDVADALAQLALTLVAAGRPAEAAPLAVECLSLREKSQPEDWSTSAARSLVGTCLAGQGEYSRAEPLLLEGFNGMKQSVGKIPAFERARLVEALQSLVAVYQATGRPEKAVEWQRRLDAEKVAQAGKRRPTPANEPAK